MTLVLFFIYSSWFSIVVILFFIRSARDVAVVLFFIYSYIVLYSLCSDSLSGGLGLWRWCCSLFIAQQ